MELEGEPVACVLPPFKATNGTAASVDWTDAKNARRGDLIDREIKEVRLGPDEPPEALVKLRLAKSARLVVWKKTIHTHSSICAEDAASKIGVCERGYEP